MNIEIEIKQSVIGPGEAWNSTEYPADFLTATAVVDGNNFEYSHAYFTKEYKEYKFDYFIADVKTSFKKRFGEDIKFTFKQ